MLGRHPKPSLEPSRANATQSSQEGSPDSDAAHHILSHFEPRTNMPAPPPRPHISQHSHQIAVPVTASNFRAQFGRKDFKTAHAAQGSEVNVPDRFELFLLGDGERKVTEIADTRTPNTSIFTFAKEDHTLANLLRAHLLKDPHVNFAGYRVPHPLFANFELRLQTDGTITPKEALLACCKNLVQDLAQLGREFTKEFELRKMVGGGADSAKDNGQ